MSSFKDKTKIISGHPRLEKKGGENMLKLRNSKGFTLIELMVVIVIIGILAGIAVPRFMGAQDRARIGAAESDINAMRQALGLYEIDYSGYLTSTSSYSDFVSNLKDPSDNAYMALPDTTNFASFDYEGKDSTYIITLVATDREPTTLIGTPEGVTR